MNKKRIALTTAISLLAAPTSILSLGVITSCNNGYPADDPGVQLSTKEVEVNYDNGVGHFQIILDEQPADNKVYVYVNTAEGEHHVELLGPNDDVYHGHPAALYDVTNGIADAYIGFTEFIGATTNTVVSLYVRYNSRSGKWINKTVYGLNLFTHYIQPEQEGVHIFALNDLHGCAEGFGEDEKYFKTVNAKNPGVIRIMDEIQPKIDQHPGSFLVTAGDNNSGDVFSTSMHGESIYKVLKAMGARYSAVGNHAFDWGAAPMTNKQFDNWARTDKTRGNYFLASNILNGVTKRTKDEWICDPNQAGFKEAYTEWQNSIVPWADPYKIVNMNGHLVCLIGLTTQSAIEDGNRDVTSHLSFINYNASVNYSAYKCWQEVGQKTYDAIESFILLTHIESATNETTQKPEGDAAELAEELTFPVDAIISGHSHKYVDGEVYNHILHKNIQIGQAETEGRRYLDLTLSFDNTRPSGEKKLKDVKIDVSQPLNPQAWVDHPTEYFDDAQAKILEARERAKSSPVLSNLVDVFDDECYYMDRALGEPIGNARRYGKLLYPAVTEVNIGHDYYINQQDGTWSDGGFICDQLGAWINYANIVGFVGTFYKEIEASAAGLTYPAVSLINQDSIKIEYADQPDESGEPVLLRDMYNIQGYENNVIFGYLSIWQLANIINHSLSGEQYFDYEDGGKDGHQYCTKEELKLENIDENNLSMFVNGYDATSGEPNSFVQVCDPDHFQTKSKYKEITDCCCLYPCGPVQWYGVRYNLTQERKDADGKFVHDRIWRIGLKENTNPATKDKIPNFPEMYILDPFWDNKETEEKEDLYSTIRTPEKWISAQTYYEKYGPMIPIVTNQFLFDGANWETPMIATYLNENEAGSWKDYPIIRYSQITRDMLIEFTKISDSSYAAQFPFDMPMDIVAALVDYSTTI